MVPVPFPVNDVVDNIDGRGAQAEDPERPEGGHHAREMGEPAEQDARQAEHVLDHLPGAEQPEMGANLGAKTAVKGHRVLGDGWG